MRHPAFLLLPLSLTALCPHAGAGAQDEPAPPRPEGTRPPVRVRLASLGTPSRLVLPPSPGLKVLEATTGTPLELPEGPVLITASGSELHVGVARVASLRVEGAAVAVEVSRRVRPYPGALLLTAAGGRITVVNECSLESYTAGVLAGECPALFHPEAIRAMAVTARSYSYRKAFLGRAELCDMTHCQVYRGADGIAPSIREAVAATAGQVALYEGEVIDAVYSSDCGGCTEANEEAWLGTRPLPYLRPVEDAPEPEGEPYCAVNRAHAWKLPLTRERLRRLHGTARAVRVELLEHTESGRVRRLQLVPTETPAEGEAGAAATPTGLLPRLFTGDAWRRQLGGASVKSLRFDVAETEAGVVLEGTGYGHGVGLCQFGANGMGRQGETWTEILAHYYTGTTVGPAPGVEEARALALQRRAAR